ncbi:carboxypeptidase-like regulatory domain-containing protein [Mongoliitalea daihaiensis]|uniref:carboxypeptidase-like regulatory domain-containing protein n=1 Tax=Mongoliitalea daihaiensis TaxID=2782006 RepID=UPI001F2A0A4F|nr:carboxypeptidase-like regulatory domain-containing protein [Mongoliitalea daihaiensis]UJP66650.1 carboxypeptidase-like regulatory domain-containing protein [Mongoliitalea daihaiensis]
MRKIVFVFLLIILKNGHSFAQTKVSGKVIHADTGEPVPFVNIMIRELAKGTVSNSQGEFNFLLPKDAKAGQELIFSHIGFEQSSVLIKDLSGKPIQIVLKPDEYEMDQALVLSFKSKEILKRMQENLTLTQYTEPHEIDIFYRELIWGNDTIQGLTRASGYVHSEGFHPKHSQKSQVSGNDFHFVGFDHIQKTDYGIINKRGGTVRKNIAAQKFPLLIFRLWDFNLSWFDYELLGGKNIGDRSVFVVAVTAKNDGLGRKASRWGYGLYELLQSSVFYVDQEDYGVHWIELRNDKLNEIQYSKHHGQYYIEKYTTATIKFERLNNGKYVFAYANYDNYYTDLGYDTEPNPKQWEVREYAEMYAMDYQFVNLSDGQLMRKYMAPIYGDVPFRRINYHVETYNGLIFIPGRARYHPEFWEDFEFPTFPQEKEIELQLSLNRPIEMQFADFKNNQLVLLERLRKRNRKSQHYWGRASLQYSPAEY